MAHAEELAFSESVDGADEDRISAGSALDIQWYKQLQSFPTNRRNSELDWLNDEVKDEGSFFALFFVSFQNFRSFVQGVLVSHR